MQKIYCQETQLHLENILRANQNNRQHLTNFILKKVLNKVDQRKSTMKLLKNIENLTQKVLKN